MFVLAAIKERTHRSIAFLMQTSQVGSISSNASPSKIRESPNIAAKGNQLNISSQNYAYLIKMQEIKHVDCILSPSMKRFDTSQNFVQSSGIISGPQTSKQRGPSMSQFEDSPMSEAHENGHIEMESETGA